MVVPCILLTYMPAIGCECVVLCLKMCRRVRLQGKQQQPCPVVCGVFCHFDPIGSDYLVVRFKLTGQWVPANANSETKTTKSGDLPTRLCNEIC